MKKILLMVFVAMMMTTVNANANEVNVENNGAVSSCDINIKAASLTRTLGLSHSQQKALDRASSELSASLRGELLDSATNQPVSLNEAINRNLKVAHRVLDHEQYHKYQTIINCTLMNKGLASAYHSAE